MYNLHSVCIVVMKQFKPNSEYALYRAFDSDEKVVLEKSWKCLRNYYPTYFCRVYNDGLDPTGMTNCVAAKRCMFKVCQLISNLILDKFNVECVSFKKPHIWFKYNIRMHSYFINKHITYYIM